MPKKAHQKKKEYQKFCRDQVRKGLMNNPEGQWVQADGKQMSKDMFNGYKFNRR